MNHEGNVKDDLRQIGQLGKKIVSGLAGGVKSRAQEIGKSAKVQAMSGTFFAAKKLVGTLKKAPDEITKRALRRKYNHLVSGGMSSEDASQFISQKVKQELEKEA